MPASRGWTYLEKQKKNILYCIRFFWEKNSTWQVHICNIEVKSNLKKSELLCTTRARMIRIVQKRGQNPISKLYTMIQIIIQMRTITPNYHQARIYSMQFLTTQIMPVLYNNQKQSMKKNKIRETWKSWKVLLFLNTICLIW